MSEHTAVVSWKFSGTDYLKGKYSREHAWVFDGGVNVPASAAPSAVPAPYSNPACVDPEEAFVASIETATCGWPTHERQAPTSFRRFPEKATREAWSSSSARTATC